MSEESPFEGHVRHVGLRRNKKMDLRGYYFFFMAGSIGVGAGDEMKRPRGKKSFYEEKRSEE